MTKLIAIVKINIFNFYYVERVSNLKYICLKLENLKMAEFNCATSAKLFWRNELKKENKNYPV